MLWITCFFLIMARSLAVLVDLSHVGCTFSITPTCATSSQYINPTTLCCTACPQNETSTTLGTCYCAPPYKYIVVGSTYSCSLDTQQFCAPTNQILYSKNSVACTSCDNEYCYDCRSSPLIGAGSGTKLNGMEAMIQPDGNCTCADGFANYLGRCVNNGIDWQTIDSGVRENSIVRFDAKISNSEFEVMNVYSDYIVLNTLPLVINCRFGLSEACQSLYNLCVLQMYRSNIACNNAAPFITEYAIVSVDSDSSLSMPVNMQTRLQLVLSTFSLNGSWLGLKYLSDELQLCGSVNSHQQSEYLTLGVNFHRECYLSIKSLMTSPTSEFYELYLLDTSVNKLFPVAVDIIDEKAEALTTYHKRFFLYDAILGVSRDDTSTSTISIPPRVIRFAETVQLTFKLYTDTSGATKLSAPILKIQYGSRSSSSLSDVTTELRTGSMESIATPLVMFSATYSTDMTGSRTAIEVFLIIGMIFAVLAAIVKTWLYMRKRQNYRLDFSALVRLTVNMFAIAADILFVIAICSALYWYLFFKQRNNVYAMIPEESDLSTFATIIYVALGLKSIEIMERLYQQSKYDIFFIDWEKTRGTLSANQSGAANREKAPISIWRTMMIANEWNKLQMERVFSIAALLLMLLFFIEGLDLVHLSFERPDVDVQFSPYLRENPMLRFAIVFIFWLTLVFLLYLYKKLFYYRFVKDPIAMFVDVCSLANISIFILTADLTNGYYIHGESVHPHADASMAEFYTNLRREEENVISSRGLIPPANKTRDGGGSGAWYQIFEIYATVDFANEFRKKLAIPIAEENISRANTVDRSNSTQQQSHFFDFITARRRRPIPPQKLIDAYNNTNKFLQEFINSIKLQQDQVLEKQLTQRLGLAPDLTLINKTFLYNDPQQTFRQLLLIGMERDLFVFYVLLFAGADYIIGKVYISLLIVYVVDCFLMSVRAHFGKQNIITKTLLDDRFLL